jgi:ABC-type nickel/cobalt efflux system permease component RcnA
MRLILGVFLAMLVLATLFFGQEPGRFTVWIAEQQRGFQNQMAGAVQALKSGQSGAYATLFLATGLYGFVHALGPGHGKYLVGGVGLGTRIATARLLAVAVASSLLQSVFAILLVYGAFSVISASAAQVTGFAEDVLTPASFIAIAGVGGLLIWRGIKAVWSGARHDHGHDHCGHSHGPTPDQVAQISSLRDAVVLSVSIALRPCTGAIFLLIIAWQMDLHWAGAWAVIVMGLGTAGLTGLVAVSSVAARRMVSASTLLDVGRGKAGGALQMMAGLLIVGFSLTLLRTLY